MFCLLFFVHALLADAATNDCVDLDCLLFGLHPVLSLVCLLFYLLLSCCVVSKCPVGCCEFYSVECACSIV